MDYGYPFTTEPNVLKEMIPPPSVLSRLTTVATGKSFLSEELPDGTLSNMPWRKTGVKYSQNEIYLDIIEEIDGVFDRNGQIISLEVTGVIMANSRLSGMPDLTLQFTDPSVIDDCSFHPCVRYSRYDRDKVVSFVPPDGQFELMRYRVNSASFISPPCYCQPQFTHETSKGKGHLSLVLGQRPSNSLIYPSNKAPMVVRRPYFRSLLIIPQVEDVSITIPFGKSVRTVNLTPSVGQLLFDEPTKVRLQEISASQSSQVAKWTIGKLAKDQSPTLNGSIIFQSGASPHSEDAPPIQLNWKVPMASISGLAVAGLQLTNETYRPYKGVRVVTKSGKYQIRSN